MSAPLHSVPPRFEASSPTRRVGRGLAVAAAAGLLAAVAAQLPAAAVPGDQSADTTVANVGVSSSITLADLTSSFALNGAPDDTVTGLSAVAYRVVTNNVGGYTVGVTAQDTALRPTGNSADTIPIENLAVRPNGTDDFTPLSRTNAITLRDKGSRSEAGGDSYSDDYRVDIPFVADDTYTVTLNYVATAS